MMNARFGITGLLLLLSLALAQPARAGVPAGALIAHAPALERAAAADGVIHSAQYLNMPSPRRPRLIPRRRLPPAYRPPRRPPRQAAPRPRPPAAGRISPSQALRKVLRRLPGSLGLGVELLPGSPPVYSVKLKTGSRIHRVLVDAISGRVLKQ